MRVWITQFKAIDPRTKELKTWCGPNVTAISQKHAQQWCYQNAGHLKVIGQLIAEIPANPQPDLKNMINYENNN